MRSSRHSQAIVFVDGRYVTQLAEQVDGSVFTGGDLVNEPPHVWLPAPRQAKGFRLGIDPWLHAGAEVRRLEKALAEIGGTLVLLAAQSARQRSGPIGRPSRSAPSSIQNVDHAGTLAKRQDRDDCEPMSQGEGGCRGASPIRLRLPGSSTSAVPTCRTRRIRLPRAIIPCGAARPSLFLDKTQDRHRAGSLSGADMPSNVPPSEFLDERLAALSADGRAGPDRSGHRRRCALARTIIRQAGGEVVEACRSCQAAARRARTASSSTARPAAHLQDGAAMVEFLCWLDAGTAGHGHRDRRGREAGGRSAPASARTCRTR